MRASTGEYHTMCEFIAQFDEHRTGIAEVTGSTPVEALIFFQLLKFENLHKHRQSSRRVK